MDAESERNNYNNYNFKTESGLINIFSELA